MDSRLENIENAVGDIRDKVQEIAIETTKNTLNLEVHMRRTEASELRLDKSEEANVLLRQYIDEVRQEAKRGYSRHQKIIDNVKFLFYFIGVVGTIIAYFVKIGLLHL